MDMLAIIASTEKHTNELCRIHAFMNEFAADSASLIQAHRGQANTFVPGGEDPIVYFTARVEYHLKQMGYV